MQPCWSHWCHHQFPRRSPGLTKKGHLETTSRKDSKEQLQEEGDMMGAERGHMAQGQVTQLAALLSHFL